MDCSDSELRETEAKVISDELINNPKIIEDILASETVRELFLSRFEAKMEVSSTIFPASTTLQQYDDLLPGTAQKVIGLIEMQINHRVHLELKDISRKEYLDKGFIRHLWFRLIVGSAITFLLVGILIYAIFSENTAAIISICAMMTGITGIYITGKHKPINHSTTEQTSPDIKS